MAGTISYDKISQNLGKSKEAWERLIGYIRFHYVMDEFWDSGKPESAYHNELKFKRGGKTLVTLYVRDGYFKVNLVFGKAERIKFEEQKADFSDTICKIYNDTNSLHDGKWLWIDIYDTTLIDDIIKMLPIKRKPNRKEAIIGDSPLMGRCGNRCDLCLLNSKNNETAKGSAIFSEGDWKVYHNDDEERVDYSKHICSGCHDDCNIVKCVIEKGIDSCIQCDYHNCKYDENNFTNPGKCNLGLSADDVTNVVIPYCGRERFDWLKNHTKSMI